MNKKSQQKISTDEQSDNDLNCSCEILNDTDLENISDSDCSCSECLQANLNAFNEFKDAEEREKLKEARSLDKIPSKKNQRNTNQQRTLRDKSLNRYGRDSKVNLNRNTISKINPLNGQETIMHEGDQKQHSRRKNYFTQQNINDYILITKQRTRQYLNQRNKISKENTKLKQEFKQKIKENLQILKYTVKSLQQHKPNDYQHQDIKSSKKTLHKWNHTPLISREIHQIRANKKECKQKLNDRRNKRQKIDTNLQNLIPQFSSNPSQFLEQVKQKRLQKLKPCKGCPHDHCPNHHMRTSKQRLLQIEQFIKDKVAKYNQKKKQQKIKKEENRKMKQAKLRAIDLKCKQILKRSKKYDPSESRTSFHLTIDHFSTFSELRAHKKEKEEERQHQKKVRKMIKQQKKGGRLEQAIYQEVLEDYNPPLESDIKPEAKKTVPKLAHKQYCEKITKEARINSPRNLKPDDEEYKKQRREKQKNPMNPNEQKKKTKEIALQIQRKKRQLMEEYKRQQEMKQAKNEKLKNKHKQSLMHSNI